MEKITKYTLANRLGQTQFYQKIGFTGTGSSYWAARISEFLWRDYVSWNSLSLQSYDFVRSKYFVSPNDIIVVFSHRGPKTFSIQALDLAKRTGEKCMLRSICEYTASKYLSENRGRLLTSKICGVLGRLFSFSLLFNISQAITE